MVGTAHPFAVALPSRLTPRPLYKTFQSPLAMFYVLEWFRIVILASVFYSDMCFCLSYHPFPTSHYHGVTDKTLTTCGRQVVRVPNPLVMLWEADLVNW